MESLVSKCERCGSAYVNHLGYCLECKYIKPEEIRKEITCPKCRRKGTFYSSIKSDGGITYRVYHPKRRGAPRKTCYIPEKDAEKIIEKI